MARALPLVLLAALTSAPLGAQAGASAAAPREVRERIAQVRRDPNALPLPPSDSITIGDRSIAPGTRVPGRVAVVRGTLDVYGQIDGDAAAIDGDVIVHEGGRVDGDAFAVAGRVRLEGGHVSGEMRTLQGAVGAVPQIAGASASPRATTLDALKLALGWLAVLIVIAIGVLVAASEYLDGVVDTAERSFGRALWTGIAGQLAILPVLVLGIVGLAITVLGILLIPFAVVAYALAVVGLVTLGFLAVAQITGRSLRRARAGRPLSARGDALRALVGGVTMYLALWIVAAAFTWNPVVGGILRGLAFAVTWVAATAGFGAALLSRAGTRRVSETSAEPPSRTDELAWATPTPITGVVAARRPTPVHNVREPR